MLVDDVPANLAVLTAALEPQGYEILAVSNGTTALQIAVKAQPSLILLDVMMPTVNGRSAATTLLCVTSRGAPSPASHTSTVC